MENILKKASQYQYNSMEYTDAEDLDGATIIFDTEEYIFILKELEEKNRLYWAANNKKAFLSGLGQIQLNIKKDERPKPLYLEFVPEDFVNELEAMNFRISSEFLDFFKPDLKVEAVKNQGLYKVRAIKADEYDLASTITKNCRDMSRGFTGESTEWVKEWSESKNSITLVAEDNEKIVGVCFLNLYGFESEKGTVLWLREIAVDPKYHSKGCGRALIEAAIAWGIEKGAKRSFLACDAENYNAMRLYESLGYKRATDRGQINMLENITKERYEL